MRWKIGEARQRFSEVVRRAATEPQLICHRDRVVAAVIDAESAAKLLRAIREREEQRSIAEAFEEFRNLTRGERFALTTPRRRNRRDVLANVRDDLSR